MITNETCNDKVYCAAVALANNNQLAAYRISSDLMQMCIDHHLHNEPVEDVKVLMHSAATVINSVVESDILTQLNLTECQLAVADARMLLFNWVWKRYTRQTYIKSFHELLAEYVNSVVFDHVVHHNPRSFSTETQRKACKDMTAKLETLTKYVEGLIDG